MLEQRTAALIQASIDGELAASDRTELASLLERSAEARQFQTEMGRFGQIMAALPELDPPADLKRRILDSIELTGPSRLTRRWAGFASSWLTPASYGVAVAAGVLIVVGVVLVSPQSPQDVRKLVGTMVRGGQDIPVASGELNIDLDVLRGQVRLKNLDQALALEFDLQTDEAVEITIDSNESGSRFGGFAPQEGNYDLDDIEISGNAVRLMNRGSHHFVLFLRDRAETSNGMQEIGIVVNRQGTEIYRGLLGSEG